VIARLCLVLAVVASSAAASAQNTAAEDLDAVHLEIADCGDVRGEDVRALIALELAPRLRIAGANEAAAALSASLRCDAPEVATITVAAPGDATPLRLDVELSKAAPPARTRLLALSVAELIATRRLQRQEPAVPVAPAPAPAAAQDEPAQAAPVQDTSAHDTPARAQLRLWIGPALARAAAPATTLLGASAGIAHSFGVLALSGELQALFGSAELADANVAVRALSARVALAPQLTLGTFVISAGAGVRAGHVQLAADAQRPQLVGDTFSGLWFGPVALAALDMDVLRPGSLRIAVETGYVVRGVAGQDAHAQTLLAMRGLWISALAAVALAF
jgi:hypothetical protein